MKVKVDGTVGRAIARYTGCEVIDLDIVPDPNCPVFAARARVERRTTHTIDFLIDVPLHRVTEDDLAEVEFNTWPPEVRS